MDTTNVKGNKGLVNVMADLVNKNLFIFLPLSDTTSVDIIASDKKMYLKKIQVKFKSISKGKIEICTSSVVNGKKVPVDLEQTDMWAVYCPDNGKVYYISTKDLKNKKTLTLRVEPSKNKQINIHNAGDYLDLNKAWNK